VHGELLSFYRHPRSQPIPEPPVPLILASWNFASDEEKHHRWLETERWAAKYGCAELISKLGDDDFVILD
jgi:hypothetical protein